VTGYVRLGRSHAATLLLSDFHNPFFTTFADALGVALERRGPFVEIGESRFRRSAFEQGVMVNVVV
jgi:DNA-binding LacI/PurR family transcriptional regulator